MWCFKPVHLGQANVLQLPDSSPQVCLDLCSCPLHLSRRDREWLQSQRFQRNLPGKFCPTAQPPFLDFNTGQTGPYIPHIIRCISKSASNFSRASSAATAAAALAPSWSLATAQGVPQSLEPGAEGVLSRFHRLCSSQRHAFELLCEPCAVVSVRQMKLCCRVRPSFVADLFYWLGLFSRRDVEASALFAFKSSNCQRSLLYILAADIPKGFR